MPITKSAVKALRQNARRRKVNAGRKTSLKQVVKQYKKLVATNKDEAKTKLAELYKRIDKSAKVSIIKKNKAARMKSRLAKMLK